MRSLSRKTYVTIRTQTDRYTARSAMVRQNKQNKGTHKTKHVKLAFTHLYIYILTVAVHHSRISVFLKERARLPVVELHSHQPAEPFLELVLVQAARHGGSRVAQHAPSPLVLVVSRDLQHGGVVCFSREKSGASHGKMSEIM